MPLRRIPKENFLAAAAYLRVFFNGLGIHWAAMGGLAMLCLGSRRPMSDIHIVYDTREFSKLKVKLQSDRRIKMVHGINLLFPSTITISTGPAFKDTNCTHNVDVEVHLFPPGSCGSPSSELLRKYSVLLRSSADGKLSNFNSLNLLYLVKSTLALCREQDTAWDPKQDLVFLCWSYGKEIEAVRHHLDPRELHEQFFSTPFFHSMSIDEQRGCSMALLGQEVTRVLSSSHQTSDQHPPQATNTPSPRRVSSNGDELLPLPRLHPDWTHYRATSAPDIHAHCAQPQQSPGLTPPAPRPRPQSMLSIAGPSYDIHDLQNASKPRIVQSRSTPSLAAKVTRKPLPKLDTNVAAGREVSRTEQILAVFRGGGPVAAEERLWKPPEGVVESVWTSTSLKRVSTHVKSVFPLEQPDHFPCGDEKASAAASAGGPSGTERKPDVASTMVESSSSQQETSLRVPKVRTESPASIPPYSNTVTMKSRLASSVYELPIAEHPASSPEARQTTPAQRPQSMTVFPSNMANMSHVPSRKPLPSSTLTRSNALYRAHPPSKLKRYSAPPQSATSNEPLLAYITSALNASLTDLDSPGSRSSTPSTAQMSPPLQISDQFRNCYQFTTNSNAKAGARHTFHLKLDALPKMNLYGYEEFAHGPYSAGSTVSENPFATAPTFRMSSGRQECIEEEDEEQGGFSYSNTPVSVMQPEWPAVDLAGYAGGLQSEGAGNRQRQEVY